MNWFGWFVEVMLLFCIYYVADHLATKLAPAVDKNGRSVNTTDLCLRIMFTAAGIFVMGGAAWGARQIMEALGL